MSITRPCTHRRDGRHLVRAKALCRHNMRRQDWIASDGTGCGDHGVRSVHYFHARSPPRAQCRQRHHSKGHSTMEEVKEEVKTEASGPSDELAALRDSEIRMQRKLTEQRRRESKVVLRAAVCESEKRKLSETVSGLQRAVQPAQKQVPPPPCPSWSPPVGARGGSPVGAWSGETSGHSAFVGAAFTSPGLGNPWDAADAGAPAGPSHPRPAAATGATTGPTLTRPYRSPTLTRLTRPHSPLTRPYRPHPMCDLVDHMGSQCTQPSSLLDSLPARPCTPLALAPPASLPLPPAPTRSHPPPPLTRCAH